MALTTSERSAQALIHNTLAQVGLSGLGSWAWSRYKAGVPFDVIWLEMQDRPEFRHQFPEIDAQRRLGIPVSSPAEILSYRRTVAGLFNKYGAPDDMATNRKLLSNMFVAGKSPVEIEQNLQDALVRIGQAPPQVGQAFSDFFGHDGQAELLRLFLDPREAQPNLERKLQMALVAGRGRQFGVDLTKNRAAQLVAAGVTGENAQQGFAELGQIMPTFTETASEQTDLTAERQGAGAVFGLSAEDARVVRQRQQERKGQFSGGGGAEGSQSGLGLGSKT